VNSAGESGAAPNAVPDASIAIAAIGPSGYLM
jgi:hypothetical protein